MHFSSQWPRCIGIISLLFVICQNTVAQEEVDGSDGALLWSSTGGGWRAMFADIGYANIFYRAGLFDETSTKFDAVSTVSGASWFSTQLFYSQEFYNQAVLAQTLEALDAFVVQWMGSYSNISDDATDETKAECDTSDIESEHAEKYDADNEPSSKMQEVCELLVEHDYDWALFIQSMLNASTTGYGDPTFVDTIANAENRIEAMKDTDLLIQAALMPNSRIREKNNAASTAVYLGYDENYDVDVDGGPATQLFTVALSAAWVVDDTGSEFWYGTDDILPAGELRTYTAEAPIVHSWEDWYSFSLYPGKEGAITISRTEIMSTDEIETTINNNDGDGGAAFLTPFGGSESTTVIQVAAISSAAGGGGSPLVPSIYTQMFSIGYYTTTANTMAIVWRVLSGLAAGLAAVAIFGYFAYWCTLRRYNSKDTSLKAAMISGTCCGLMIGSLVGVFVGLKSVLVATVYDMGVDSVYRNPQFDKFAVCSQWPNTCGTRDAQLIDGYFVDNPAVVINVGHYQQKHGMDGGNETQTMRLIITNTNQHWDNEFNIGQILQYFSTYFNQDVAPGGYLWTPGLNAPYRSPQIFSEYLDKDGLNAALNPIPDSNMTTATFKATTIQNPSFGVLAGQTVDILLLNLNADITTFVVGKTVVEDLTQPLADMTTHIAFNEELLERVRAFVDGTI